VTEGVAHVSVRILEKEYQIACPADARNDLLNCAALLNSKMREIRDSGKVIGLERIAIMAALNMANELLQSRNRDEHLDSNLGHRLKTMRERVETALQQGRQLDF
jgi:cell division protein ZapA